MRGTPPQGGEGMSRRINDYFALTKPRLTSLNLAMTAFAYALGADGRMSGTGLFHVLLGMGLVAGGGGALNMYWERHLDALMTRTRNRPLPSKRISAGGALTFGFALSLAGIGHLAYHCDRVTAFLSFLALAIYVGLYTPLKIRTVLNTWVGAVTGALPPLIGWSAATGGKLSPAAWSLFAILFVWQMPHFFALACVYRQDYARAGFKMLGTGQAPSRLAESQILLWSLALIPVSLLPVTWGLAGGIYGGSALALGAMLLPLAVRLYFTRAPQDGQLVFLASLAYLPLLFGIMLFDRSLGAV